MSSIINNTSLMYEVIEKIDYMVRVMDGDHKVIYMNKKMRDEFAYTMGDICYTLLGRTEKCEHCITSESKETGKPDAKDVAIGDKFYKVMSSPVSIDNGENYSVEILHDITEQKETERKLLNHYEKLKSDIEFAKHIQNCVLPINGEYWNTINLSSLYLPSEDMGGDLFDIIKIDDDRILLYIADVSGHGVRSSLLTIFLRQLIRGRTYESDIDLQELLDAIVKSYCDLGIDKEYFISVLFCCYDRKKRKVSILNAGHNCLPLIIKEDGQIMEVEVSGMPVCCLIDKFDHNQVEINVETGDRIILCTDGITEAFNKELKKAFGSEGIIKIIRENPRLQNDALIDKTVEAVKQFADVAAADDIAILIAEII